MRVCAVKNCKPPDGESRSFFPFPVESFDESWLPLLGQEIGWEPCKNTTLCEVHYTEDCFSSSTSKHKLLTKDALPFGFKRKSTENPDMTVMDHAYSIDPESANVKIKKLYNEVDKLRKKNDALRKQKRRLTNKVASLDEAIKLSLEENNVATDDITLQNLYEQSANIPAEFFKSYTKKIKLTNNNEPISYCDDLRKFAFSLHNISAKAYRWDFSFNLEIFSL